MPSPSALLVGLPALLLAACSVPVANGLDEPEANRIVVTLDRASIDATKELDPGSEGKFRVNVARDDVASALGAMRDEELPRPHPPGVLDAFAKGALVPSETEERAAFVAGLEGDFERTLDGVDGVLSARVHLNLPEADGARDHGAARGSASVLVEHRGATPPLSADAVQRIIAGGAPGLTTSDVAVVLLPRPAPPATRDRGLAHVGPIAVARGSLHTLEAAFAALVAVVTLLAGVTLFLYVRLRGRGDATS
jgi:type III secretion protein J